MKRCLIIFLICLSGFGFTQNQVNSTIDSCKLHIKNIISIDCGRINNDYIFRIYNDCEMHDFKITIYNRWAEILFESTDINQPWYAGNQPQGTYVYVICGTTIYGQVFDFSGHITVLK